MMDVDYLTYKLDLDYSGFKELFNNFINDYELEFYNKIVTYNNTEVLVYENHVKYMAVIFIKSNHLTEEELYMIENEYLFGHYKGEVFKKVFTILCVDKMYDVVENYLKMGIDVFVGGKDSIGPLYHRLPLVYDVSNGSLILSNSASFKYNKHALIQGWFKKLDEFQAEYSPFLESFFIKNKYDVDKIRTNTRLSLNTNCSLFYPEFVVLFKKDFYVNSSFCFFVIIFLGVLILPFINSFKKEFFVNYLLVFSLLLILLLSLFVSMKRIVYRKSKKCKMIWLGSDISNLCDIITHDKDFIFVDSFDNCLADDSKLYLIKGEGYILVNNTGNCDKLIKKLIDIVKKFLN